MRSRNNKKEQHQYSILTPWDIDAQDTPLNKYCSRLLNLRPYKEQKQLKEIRQIKSNNRQNTQNKQKEQYGVKKNINTLPNLGQQRNKKRAISHCNPHKQQIIPIIQKTIQTQNFKSYQQILQETIQNPKTCTQYHQNKTERVQKREPLKRLQKGQRGALQQISVKNFVIEGSTQGPKDKPKKRQSTYILKQKFAQFRKSMKFMASNNKENQQMKIIRYQ